MLRTKYYKSWLLLRGIASDIAEYGYYSIMADESTDPSNNEQLVICICWVNQAVCEKYISLMPVAQTNADTIVVCIKDVLLRMNHRIQDAHEQCYDECLTMTGSKWGCCTNQETGEKKVC